MGKKNLKALVDHRPKNIIMKLPIKKKEYKRDMLILHKAENLRENERERNPIKILPCP